LVTLLKVDCVVDEQAAEVTDLVVRDILQSLLAHAAIMYVSLQLTYKFHGFQDAKQLSET